MSEPTYEQVEAIVRAVAAAWVEPATEPEPIFEGRLLGLKEAQRFDRANSIRVRTGTVVTPLARDWIKKLGSTISVAKTREPLGGCWGFAVEHESGVTAALRRSLSEGSSEWVEIGATARDAARWAIAARDRGAAVLTDEASVSAWSANQVPGVRAAVATDADSVSRSIARLGANVLIVEARSHPIHYLKHLLSTYRRGGPPRLPPLLATLQEPSNHEDRRDHRPGHVEPWAHVVAERSLRDRLALAAIGHRNGSTLPG